MIPRLFTSLPLVPGTTVHLDPAAAHHALRVLRLGAGDTVELFDGDGEHAAATLLATPVGSARIERLLPADPLPTLRLTLAQCISASEKMDWTIEKAVELGVSAIVPLQSRKAIVRLTGARSTNRREHWLRLILAASAQSGRSRVPRLDQVTPLSDWIRVSEGVEGQCQGPGACAAREPDAPAGVLRILLTPGAERSLNQILAEAEVGEAEAGAGSGPGPAIKPAIPDQVWLLCGPESGFSDAELLQAREAGWLPAALGPRVLRTETAGLAALAVVQARWGDLR